MDFKRFCIAIVCLFILFALVISFEGTAQAGALPMSGDPTCRALRPECFPPGKVRDDLIHKRFSEGFKVPDDKLLKFPSDEKAASARKQICAGSDCPPSLDKSNRSGG
jgi:hypothetical protein